MAIEGACNATGVHNCENSHLMGDCVGPVQEKSCRGIEGNKSPVLRVAQPEQDLACGSTTHRRVLDDGSIKRRATSRHRVYSPPRLSTAIHIAARKLTFNPRSTQSEFSYSTRSCRHSCRSVAYRRTIRWVVIYVIHPGSQVITPYTPHLRNELHRPPTPSHPPPLDCSIIVERLRSKTRSVPGMPRMNSHGVPQSCHHYLLMPATDPIYRL